MMVTMPDLERLVATRAHPLELTLDFEDYIQYRRLINPEYIHTEYYDGQRREYFFMLGTQINAPWTTKLIIGVHQGGKR